MPRPKIDAPGRFLVDNGILFEINRQVLHPLGLQLDLAVREDGTTCDVVIVDNRSVEDPIYFSPDDFKAGRDLYESYMVEHGRSNLRKRRKIGMVIQTGPNIRPHAQPEANEDE